MVVLKGLCYAKRCIGILFEFLYMDNPPHEINIFYEMDA
jgi:hypothetical protein